MAFRRSKTIVYPKQNDISPKKGYISIMKNRGFTTIELMAVLVIGAIILTLAIPSFTLFVKNNRLTTVANTFIGAMNYARAEAVKRNATITVTANASGWAFGWEVSEGATLLRSFPAVVGGVTLVSVGGNTSLQFLSTGTVNTSDTFRVCDDRTAETGRAIDIGTLGRASVSTYTCS